MWAGGWRPCRSPVREAAELPGLGGRRRRMAGGGVIDRDQGQAQVAYFLEQSVQRRLVGDRAFDGGDAVAAAGEGQPVEPGGPPDVEVSLNADLVPSRVLMAAGRCLVHDRKL